MSMLTVNAVLKALKSEMEKLESNLNRGQLGRAQLNVDIVVDLGDELNKALEKVRGV